MPVAASTDAADRIPGAWVDVVDGAGHFVWVETPGAVRASLRRLTAVQQEAATADSGFLA
jgi:pimeloyl-ACP methyl ester carboxylesterase